MVGCSVEIVKERVHNTVGVECQGPLGHADIQEERTGGVFAGGGRVDSELPTGGSEGWACRRGKVGGQPRERNRGS